VGGTVEVEWAVVGGIVEVVGAGVVVVFAVVVKG
jgi:hypothetical protein